MWVLLALAMPATAEAMVIEVIVEVMVGSRGGRTNGEASCRLPGNGDLRIEHLHESVHEFLLCDSA